MPRLSTLALTSLLLLSHSTALAQSAAAPAPAPAPAPADPTPGIVVILATLAAGAALTSYGLTIDCAEQDHACHRRAALPIWGGIGVAAVGSLIGLRLVQSSGAGSAAVVSVYGRF